MTALEAAAMDVAELERRRAGDLEAARVDELMRVLRRARRGETPVQQLVFFELDELELGAGAGDEAA